MEVQIDYDKIELDYRSGVLSELTVCEKHGITIGQLKSAAASRGWAREMLTPEDQCAVLEIASSPRFPIDSIFNNDDIKRHALMTAGEMVRLHRKDIARMRGVAAIIMERLEKFVIDPENEDNIKAMLKIVGKNEWASDLFEKLSRILTRVIELERQAFGLESMTIVPDYDGENQVAKEIKALSERLKLITENKAQKVLSKGVENVVERPN